MACLLIGDIMKLVPDTSAIIAGIVADIAEQRGIREIIIPEFVISELQAQASKRKEIGFTGLEEIKKLREAEKAGRFSIETAGRRQTMEEIRLAKSGRVDALIVDVAKQESALFVTCDIVQKLVAEAEGLEVVYVEPYHRKEKNRLDEYLTDDTMSIHLKENAIPMAKRGKPGAFRLVKLRDTPMSRDEIEAIIDEIHEIARYEEGFLEYSESGASVYQIGDRRISIARPPFSDGLEVTLVRSIAKVSLDDYRLADALRKRLEERAEGIIIAGPPGSGKSTFAAALAEFYESKGKIVKTMESPRDLQVKEEITQYKPLAGSFEKTADILLLVRPDYTVYDEIRKTSDFMVFSDLRMAGIGMIGVVHATEPINAIQRFMGRMELGIIPHIIDTVIFIKAGRVEKVLTLRLVVRPPTGMNEDDLARPLIEVRDMEGDRLLYEIYTFGDENVVIPVEDMDNTSAIENLAKQRIMDAVKKYDRNAEVEIISDSKVRIRVSNDAIPKIIGRSGKTVQMLEDRLGVSIDIEPKIATAKQEVPFGTDETGKSVVFMFNTSLIGKNVSIYDGNDFLISGTVGKDGKLKIAKKNGIGRRILSGLLKGSIHCFV